MRLEAGLHGRRFGLRLGFAAETERNQRIESRTVSWRRLGLSLGPTLDMVERPLIVNMRAEVFAGFTRVAGHGFDADQQSGAVAPGLALALRVQAPTGRVRPWVEVGGQYWLARQEIVITKAPPPASNASLPSAEGRFFVGVSALLSH